MCGFIGKFSNEKINQEGIFQANKHTICRGPDQLRHHEGSTRDSVYSLIFNRLSILDLTDNASQPMVDEFGNILMFNGEVYNHRELRSYLENKSIQFKSSHSDTEVILHGIRVLGVDFLNKIIGQFAIFYLNKTKGVIFLARDRLGQKPLFYSKTDNKFTVSSNLKSLVKLNTNFHVDEESLSEYLETGVISSPKTLFKNIYKLRPAEIIEVNIENNYKIKKNLFWKPEDFIQTKKTKFNFDEFSELLKDAVNIRQNADVEVANMLSGGIDSTTIVKLASENNNKLNTFSVTNTGTSYNEEEWINKVANKYQVIGKYVDINFDNINLETINESIDAFDEPYSDPSTLPSFLIYKEISKNFKVAISGDGGDELLGGYQRVIRTLNRNNFASKFFSMYPGFIGTGNKLQINQKNLKGSYLSFYKDTKLMNLLKLKNSFLNDKFTDIEDSEYLSMILFDYKYYLPEMMMLKVDRASMANSLEVRSPFVDHRLIEYMINSDFEVNNEESQKLPLKKILSNDFDNSFLNRKKMGFVFDLENWVYSNSDYINDYFRNESNFINNLNNNILKTLSINKSRINAQRIWRIYFLEYYFNSLQKI